MRHAKYWQRFISLLLSYILYKRALNVYSLQQKPWHAITAAVGYWKYVQQFVWQTKFSPNSWVANGGPIKHFWQPTLPTPGCNQQVGLFALLTLVMILSWTRTCPLEVTRVTAQQHQKCTSSDAAKQALSISRDSSIDIISTPASFLVLREGEVFWAFSIICLPVKIFRLARQLHCTTA